jgi:acetylornithine deacetylase/succinyl-diaminopimelate desuccinylase-like protein
MPIFQTQTVSFRQELPQAVHNLLTDTINVTGFNGGLAPNVVPSEVSANLDCRLLPGTTPEAMLARLRTLLRSPSP